MGALALVGTSGCASVVCGRHADLTFHSNVPGAQVKVIDTDGHEVGTTHTPGTVTVRRKRGWLKPDEYKARISAPGYQTVQFPVQQKVSPWVWGNILLGYVGGPVGLAIDNMTGAAWAPKKDTMYRELTPLVYAADSYETPEQPENFVEVASGNAPATVSDLPPNRVRDEPEARLVSFEQEETFAR